MSALKILLILFALTASADAYQARLNTLDDLTSMIVYAILFCGLTTLLLLCAFMRPYVWRLGWSVVFFAAFALQEAAQSIFGEPLRYSAFVTLISARGFIGDSLAQYSGAILGALGYGLALAVGIALPGSLPRTRLARAASLAPLLAIGSLTGLLYARGGLGAAGLPSSFTPLSYFALYSYETWREDDTPRQPVALTHDNRAPVSDVVLIVDESVRGDYLDINSPHGVDTPFDADLTSARIHNFGLAVSATNCSDASNLILRYGGTRETFRQHIAYMPSIWAYARQAGYATVYIDSQRTGGSLHNAMTHDEASEIDALVQFENVPVLQRDAFAARELTRRLANDTPEFIYMTKVGAHFPVHDKFPDDHLLYQPALPRGSFSNISDTGERAGMFGGDWDRYRNSYKNTLLWNTTRFFEHVLAHDAIARATVLYTADHGQNFHERGEPGLNTHCSPTPSPEEGVVPLVVISGDHTPLDFERAADSGHDRRSHYQIFPTLLKLLGYAPTDVQQRYGASLTDQVNDPMTFNHAFHGRLGSRERWKAVDLDSLVGPPPGKPGIQVAE